MEAPSPKTSQELLRSPLKAMAFPVGSVLSAVKKYRQNKQEAQNKLFIQEKIDEVAGRIIDLYERDEIDPRSITCVMGCTLPRGINQDDFCLSVGSGAADIVNSRLDERAQEIAASMWEGPENAHSPERVVFDPLFSSAASAVLAGDNQKPLIYGEIPRNINPNPSQITTEFVFHLEEAPNTNQV